VKTDRRDALKLARNCRAGELTAVWLPDAEHEALRDLVRTREAAKKDQLRARHRLPGSSTQSRFFPRFVFRIARLWILTQTL
jgi:transposase